MIKDINTGDYFENGKALIEWLNIDSNIESEMTLSINNCNTELDYIDFANEYILKENDGMLTHEYILI